MEMEEEATGAEEGEKEKVSVVVTPHVGRIEDKPNSWYSKFHLLVSGPRLPGRAQAHELGRVFFLGV